jgi:hypothetical protein
MENKIKIVGFVGKIGSGKTTVARYMYEKYGYTVLRFADALKSMLVFGLGISPDNVYGNNKSEPCEELCGNTVRHAMITLGTEWGRNLIHPDIWVVSVENKLKKEIKYSARRFFVIDDVRFLNEANWLMRTKHTYYDGCGFAPNVKLIRIVRDTDKVGIVHQSETEQDNIIVDSTLHNTDTLENLYVKVDKIVSDF